ncbi:2-succinyl-5-enolpyruvyl-6-hydroxy-3-cyclohexene-1-carboxylic-acid synthase [Metabacillus dongyingensis]|uniref:2-succinyl-5-enolpyruvyl-6-hydroxy-3- cyclohexene-1-carboxylic-acid synthase n=1 Tax=Metabacillus dongyingensis TaxID=2874282 RepID=UPI001CBE066C|nr:2-succinyl-5-enolpyruvyl-6-hydroxy-3-cyclohexene-1-carboxylic-acid synthase [Metabacillus dongyingensis]UAL51457.1 2-succinyl-5-enolpyruvyl-6-hydroxy-3-cyclohexene-1-carboxylic-acid synthase [Metabacillus dongyingensis]
MSANKSLTLYAASFVDELSKAGVRDAVISPGSRSTPMAMLMAEHPDLNIHVLIDERSAGFFALGMAKMQQRPVALLCTSGTAAANYYPAVVEAFYSRVPLLVLTADRPHELRDVGAPQAIDQMHLFGRYAKWFADMAVPEHTAELLQYGRTMAARAAGKAISSPSGPVHLNFPFREPLVPDLESEDLWTSLNSRPKQVQVTAGSSVIDLSEVQRLAGLLSEEKKGLIICGELRDPDFAEAAVKLSSVLKYPILADPLSNLRTGSHDQTSVIECYDAFMKDEYITEQLKPEVIIRFGAMPVSKPLFLFLKRTADIRQIVVDGQGGWREPTLMAAEMIECKESWLCRELIKQVKIQEDTDWLQSWKKVNLVSRELLGSAEDKGGDLFEGNVFRELQHALPQKCHVIAGNSMPIRDLDNYFLNTEKNIAVYANRGANGIDGIVSTALGMSTGAGTDHPTFLVIGDLSFYHDMNGLLAAKMHKLNLTIILVNNDGGGIFSFLPQSKEEKHFETLFGTPTGLDFKHAADLYDASYSLPATWEEFRSAVSDAVIKKGLNIIEVRTNRQTRVSIHRELMNRVSQEIREKFFK